MREIMIAGVVAAGLAGCAGVEKPVTDDSPSGKMKTELSQNLPKVFEDCLFPNKQPVPNRLMFGWVQRPDGQVGIGGACLRQKASLGENGDSETTNGVTKKVDPQSGKAIYQYDIKG